MTRRYFTHYWRNDTWDVGRENGHEGTHNEHTAGNDFRSKGVKRGDQIYVVTIRSGRLYLNSRGTVDLVTNHRDAARRLGTHPELLWAARDHVLMRKDDASIMMFDRTVPIDRVRKLEMLRVNGPRALKFIDDSRLDQQSLRGVCELTPASAAILDSIVANPPASSQAAVAVLRKERAFEVAVVEPLIGRWNFTFKGQHKHFFRRGTQSSHMIIDHLVSDPTGPLTLFENKARIHSPSELSKAEEQARSYAHELSVTSFIVAAPEGLWLYSLWQGEAKLVHKVAPLARLVDDEQRLRERLLAIRNTFKIARPSHD